MPSSKPFVVFKYNDLRIAVIPENVVAVQEYTEVLKVVDKASLELPKTRKACHLYLKNCPATLSVEGTLETTLGELKS